MEMFVEALQQFPNMAFAATALGSLLLVFLTWHLLNRKKYQTCPSLPAVPGLPLIGNLLQLKDKKPYQTFLKWAEIYGPIYSIRTGASTVVVLNSADVAKEAMVTRFPSITTRKFSKAMMILSANKSFVATSDYNDFHKMTKRYVLAGMLGANAQKRHRYNRDTMIERVFQRIQAEVKDNPLQPVNLRTSFKPELFGLVMREALGTGVESPIYVEELGTRLSQEEVFQVLVVDPMTGAIEIDWRDFFPYLRWVPNKSFEMKIRKMDSRRHAVLKTLIEEQTKKISAGEELNCYLELLLSEGKTLTEKEVLMLIWETIIEASDTTFVTVEWAMYELAKSQKQQERLYEEIRKVCGAQRLTEDDLSQLPYLNAVVHETLRKYTPIPIVPMRYAHEDTELGGYHIPAGSEIAINLYGCNMDKNRWVDPEEWTPERFLDGKFDPTDHYKTMAFGGGKRVCSGSLQALTITSTCIGRLVQEYKWKLIEGQDEDVTTVMLTTNKLNPLLTIITPRDLGN